MQLYKLLKVVPIHSEYILRIYLPITEVSLAKLMGATAKLINDYDQSTV